jgi:hypothetical protein
MLWQVPGHSVDEAVTFLRSLGRLSDAGQALGRLLGNGDASPEHAALAAQFWQRSIRGGTVETLAGFGWYAEISALDDITWARLTRQTLTIARGRIEWARNVAGRAARPRPTPDTLEILTVTSYCAASPMAGISGASSKPLPSQSRKLIAAWPTLRSTSVFVPHSSNAGSTSPRPA